MQILQLLLEVLHHRLLEGLLLVAQGLLQLLLALLDLRVVLQHPSREVIQ